MIKYGVVIQARMGSKRCPGKINFPLIDEPMLSYQIKRLKAGGIRNIVIATTILEGDNVTELIATKNDVPCYRGSENDVLKRFVECCQFFNIENVIRVGGDDPLIDPNGIKILIKKHVSLDKDLIYNSHRRGWIYGTAAELVKFKALKKAHDIVADGEDREHLINYLKRSKKFSRKAVQSRTKVRRPDIFLSVDYAEDLDLIEQIVKAFDKSGKRYTFSQEDIIELFDSGNLIVANKHLHSGF